MTADGRRVGLAAACFLLPAVLSAQTLPLPRLPPQEPAAAGLAAVDTEPPPEAVGGSARRPPAWEYSFGIGAGWDNNIDFRVPDGPSGLALSPRGSVARAFSSPKGELRLGGSARWFGYPEYKEQSRYDADVSLDGTYRPSRSTTWSAGVSYSQGYSDTSKVLTEQGVLLPLVETRTLSGSLGVTRNLGRRSSLRLDGRVYTTVFDQTEAAAVTLVDGLSFRGTAALQRTIGARDGLALAYSLEDVLRNGLGGEGGTDRYLTHYASLQWSHLLSPQHGFLIEAGGSYTPEAGQAGLQRSESFFGGASYSREVKRSRLSIYARREVAPAFGLGVSRVESRFGLSATVPMGRSWTLRLAGSHVAPETPDAAPLTYSTPDEASLVLARRLGRYFQMSTEVRYLRRGATSAVPTIETFRVGLFLSLVSPS